MIGRALARVFRWMADRLDRRPAGEATEVAVVPRACGCHMAIVLSDGHSSLAAVFPRTQAAALSGAIIRVSRTPAGRKVRP